MISKNSAPHETFVRTHYARDFRLIGPLVLQSGPYGDFLYILCKFIVFGV